MDISATLRPDGLKGQKQKHIKLYASIGSTIVTIYFPDIYCLVLFLKHIFNILQLFILLHFIFNFILFLFNINLTSYCLFLDC